MLPRVPRRSMVPVVLAAALIAAATTAGVASATSTGSAGGSVAADDTNPLRPGFHAPVGGTVPGLTGDAAERAAGPAVDRFRQIAEDRTRRLADLTDRAAGVDGAAAAAAYLHMDWGIYLPQSKGVGLRATHSVFTGAQAVTHGDDVVYAPTALPAGGSCIEMTTAYLSDGPVVWAWNWCNGSHGVAKLVKIDSSFLSTYTTTVNGYPAYTMDAHQTVASNNTWTAYLFNYRTRAWDTFYTSSGTYDLKSYTYGWDIFEIYSTVDPATGNAYYCAGMNGRKFETSDLQVMVNGVWTAASASNSYPVSTNPSGSRFDCPTLRFTLEHANDHWIAQIGNAPATSAAPTTRPPTSAAPTTRPPTTSVPTSRPPTSAVPTTRPPTTSVPTTRPATSAPVTTRPATSGPPTGTGSGCAATYRIVGSWQGGFQGEIAVTNTRPTATSSWAVTLTFADGQVVTQVWGGEATQSGSTVTIRNTSWNGALAPNATTTAGFLANSPGANSVPTLACAAG